MDDTIAAIATAAGPAAIGVIRISGPLALSVLRRIARRVPEEAEPRRLMLRWVRHPDSGEVLDRAFLWFDRGPKTYTGQDIAEVQGHGGILGMERLLAVVLAAGARLAEPGEFTFRAFLNGRIDLSEAEAVCEYIGARSHRAVEAATVSLRGEVGREVDRLRQKTVEILAEIEAEVDFPDEEVGETDREMVVQRLGDLGKEIARWGKSYGVGRLVAKGARVGIVGRTNVGKSSLLNRLVGFQRAVVLPEPGTTRDYIEQEMEIEGLAVVFVDTVGVRWNASSDEVWAALLTGPALVDADLVLVLADASCGATEEDQRIWQSFEAKNRLVVWNKVDLAVPSGGMDEGPWRGAVQVSAATGEGIAVLKERLVDSLTGRQTREVETLMVTQARHREALANAAEAIRRAMTGLASTGLVELAAVDLREALGQLGRIVGQDVGESVLQSIFSRFCIGK